VFTDVAIESFLQLLLDDLVWQRQHGALPDTLATVVVTLLSGYNRHQISNFISKAEQ